MLAHLSVMTSMTTKRTNLKLPGPTRAAGVNQFSIFKSPLGDLLLVADGSALVGLYFAGSDHVPVSSQHWTQSEDHPILRQAKQQLREYFDATRKTFSLPFRLTGTEFQEKIWREIALIPYGQTVSYSELANRVGSPKAVRAAGTSTGRNPVSIIIPCHRVVGKNGNLTGFAGGMERKERLLGLEKS
jgi:methylated-DNA-[protein]-cysteine S-methyltransferase